MNVVYFKEEALDTPMGDMAAGSIFIHISPHDKDLRHMFLSLLTYADVEGCNVLYTALDAKQTEVVDREIIETLMKNSEN